MDAERQNAQDAIHDLVKDSIETIGNIRYSDISGHERDKLLRELQDNLWNIDALRRTA